MCQQQITRQKIEEITSAFMTACTLGAAAELDIFTTLGDRSLAADELAQRLHTDRRATRILLDAVAAIGFLDKLGDRYSVPAEARGWLSTGGPDTMLPMIHHRTNLMRHWSHLSQITKTGVPCPYPESIRGAEADRATFIAAMHTYSGPVAEEVVGRLGPLSFRRLLDVGGASGTWTLALLRAVPQASATIFDLPDSVRQAADRIAASSAAERITLAEGDFYRDDLPTGFDFAWVSAIIHQHDRRHNRDLFAKVYKALEPGGRIAIRDVVMEPDRIHPRFGALFAINMLVNTDSGGTFTFDEIARDLEAAGFTEPRLRSTDPAMNGLVVARKA